MSQYINNKNYTISFVTTCFNRFYQLEHVYYQNIKKYSNNSNVEFILIDFSGEDTNNIKEYIITNLFNELKIGKLKYYKRNNPLNKFNMSSAKNVSHLLGKNDFLYNLDGDNILDGTEYDVLIENINKYGENIVIHQNDGPSQLLHNMWKKYNYNYSNNYNYHNNDLIWNGTSGRICINSKIYKSIGGYSEDLELMGMDDIDILIRLVNINCKYIHVNLKNSNMFIDNDSDKSTNSNNWKTMEKNLDNKNYINKVFKEDINNYNLFDINNFKILTCFSVLYKSDNFIDNLINDILNQNIFNNINFILINVFNTNTVETNMKINNLIKFNNIKIINEDNDYGLYNMWNTCIKMSETYFVSNMNPDDIRGPEWAYQQIIHFEPNINLVTPKYIPVKQIINHNKLINNNEIWFEKKCDIINKKAHYYGNNNYFDSKDMFQYVNNKIITYCIPNCSPIWRKKIHNNNNYFNENKYGCYTDYVMWLEQCSNNNKFKQTNYKVGFYISDNQLHRKQINNYDIFISLILKYANNNYINNMLENIFDLSQTIGKYGTHHRFGWNNVQEKIKNNFIHNNDGILLDLFCERTFFWNLQNKTKEYYHNKKWIGFIHSTNHNYNVFDNNSANLKYLLENKYFKKSLEKCLGLIVLSTNNKIILEKYMAENNLNIKIYSILHPCELNNEIFKYNKSNTINHIGWHLRDYSAFSKLKWDNKRLILPDIMSQNDFMNKYILKSCNEHNIIYDNKIKLKNALNNNEYDELLKTELIFNKIIEPSASNLICECISFCNPIILNRHSSFEDYLGKDYPMFYDDINDIPKLITEENINESSKYLLKIREKISYELFIINFKSIIKSIL